ncbi:MAG: hypothetical protein EOP34_01535 [Rickettsiales bacterium]|nr:MAG: hypothetical protein EOP34_01535 [Rickettsiales bacterium]
MSSSKTVPRGNSFQDNNKQPEKHMLVVFGLKLNKYTASKYALITSISHIVKILLGLNCCF